MPTWESSEVTLSDGVLGNAGGVTDGRGGGGALRIIFVAPEVKQTPSECVFKKTATFNKRNHNSVRKKGSSTACSRTKVILKHHRTAKEVGEFTSSHCRGTYHCVSDTPARVADAQGVVFVLLKASTSVTSTVDDWVL